MERDSERQEEEQRFLEMHEWSDDDDLPAFVAFTPNTNPWKRGSPSSEEEGERPAKRQYSESDEGSEDDRKMPARVDHQEREVEIRWDDDRGMPALAGYVDKHKSWDVSGGQDDEQVAGSRTFESDESLYEDQKMPARVVAPQRGVESDEGSDDDRKMPARRGPERNVAIDRHIPAFAVNAEEENQKDISSEREEADERPRANYASMAPSIHVGIIKRVYVENFMCHRKFTIDFCRNVNFITGQNGSGKSAILAAIQICLGSGARTTHRAGNLKDLIRADGSRNQPTEAIVRVSLTNEGSDAYEADKYGKTITVERTITRSGGFNGYKLLDEAGREVSRKKKDLCRMLDHLNIQVDNPVAVLDQEKAKKFLLGSDTEKYEFFQKANDLSRINAKYSATLEEIEELKVTLEQMTNALAKKELLVNEAKKRVKEHEELDKLESKLKDAEIMYAWSLYKVAVDEHQNETEVLAKDEAKVKQREIEIVELERTALQASSGNEEDKHRQSIDELIRNIAAETEKKQSLELQLRQQMVARKQLEKEGQIVSKDRTEIKRQLDLAQIRCSESRKQLSERNDPKEAELLSSLNNAEQELHREQNEIAKIKQALSTSSRHYEELSLHVDDARAKVHSIGRQLDSVTIRIRALEATSADSFFVFGPNVKKVYNMIQRHISEGKFRGPVVGPVAHYIKIVAGKEKFAAVAEKALGRGMLDRFVVNSDEDRKLLQIIREEAGCKSDCGIMQTKECARFRTAPFDVAGVERVVALCDDKASSENLLYYEKNGRDAIRSPIQDVYFLPEGGKWTVKGGNKADILDGRTMLQTLGVDKKYVIAHAKEEAMLLKSELQRAHVEHDRLEHDCTEQKRQQNHHQHRLRTNTEKTEMLSNKISELKDLVEASTTFQMDTGDHEEDIMNLERELEEVDIKDEKISDETTEINECSTSIEELCQKSNAAEETLTQFLHSISLREDQLERKRQKLSKSRASVDTSRKRAEALEIDVKAALRQARLLEFSRNVPHDPSDGDLEAIQLPEGINIRKPKHYDARIENLRNQIEREKEHRNISRDDKVVAYEKYTRALNDCSSQREVVDELEAKITILKNDLQERKYLKQDMQEHLEKTTNWKFKELLRVNDYNGNVTFDGENETLRIHANKTSDKNTMSNDVKNLSGGEKATLRCASSMHWVKR